VDVCKRHKDVLESTLKDNTIKVCKSKGWDLKNLEKFEDKLANLSEENKMEHKIQTSELPNWLSQEKAQNL
jgi:hypothetical protein